MVKRTKLMRVHEDFALYVDDMSKSMKRHGKEMPLVDVTELIARRDKRFFGKKKSKQEEDFLDIMGL